jgi:hypothetical protein
MTELPRAGISLRKSAVKIAARRRGDRPHPRASRKGGATRQEIADILGVSQRTISNDLAGLLVANKPPRPKGGRPKANPKRLRALIKRKPGAAELWIDGENSPPRGLSGAQAAKQKRVDSSVSLP